jgi:hypothetical protein
MTDAWEIIGRLITDDEFKTEIFGGVYSGPYPMNTTNRAQIPEQDYQTVRERAATKVKGPISLAAAGEVLIAMRFPDFRPRLDDLAKAIKTTGINTAGRKPVFYQTLGASMADMRLLGRIANRFSEFGLEVGGDNDDLTTVLTDNGVIAAAKAFCSTCWTGGCQLRMIFWPEHVHPVESPFSLKF